MTSETFNPNRGDIIKSSNSSGSQLCRTSFVPFKLKEFLKGKTYSSVRVEYTKIPGFPTKDIFCLVFINDTTAYPPFLGDLPCPDLCIPDKIISNKNTTFTIPATFEKGHFDAVLNEAMQDPAKLIGVGVSYRGGSATENSFTLFLHTILIIDRTPALPAYITI